MGLPQGEEPAGREGEGGAWRAGQAGGPSGPGQTRWGGRLSEALPGEAALQPEDVKPYWLQWDERLGVAPATAWT